MKLTRIQVEKKKKHNLGLAWPLFFFCISKVKNDNKLINHLLQEAL